MMKMDTLLRILIIRMLVQELEPYSGIKKFRHTKFHKRFNFVLFPNFYLYQILRNVAKLKLPSYLFRILTLLH
jgi:hypothetical protein